ncbi:MAG: hypothetical protein IJA85_01850 [Clostridia bacterium]|nr:hypothetical protein [Clostridia bacterium]
MKRRLTALLLLFCMLLTFSAGCGSGDEVTDIADTESMTEADETKEENDMLPADTKDEIFAAPVEVETPAEDIAAYYDELGELDFASLGCKIDTNAKIEDDSRNGTDFIYVTSEKYHYSFGYYSNNPWVNSDVIIMSRGKEAKDFHNCELVAVDMKNRAVYELGIVVNDFSEFVVWHELLYYIKGSTLSVFNLKTGEKRELLTYNGGIGFPHMTNDGRYMNFASTVDGKCTGVIYDIEKNETKIILQKNFSAPFNVANHMMISPINPNMMFFSHEGTTQYISNRLWMAEMGKEPYCIVKQNLTENYDLGDCVGHECWSFDGKGLWYVKYSLSPTPPRGICYIDLAAKDNSVQVLYSKYPYWHVSCSPDGRYVGADTQSGSYSGVCLIDRTTGEESMLVKARTNWVHPCHPHPCFSPASDKLAFHDMSIDDTVSVGIITITK